MTAKHAVRSIVIALIAAVISAMVVLAAAVGLGNSSDQSYRSLDYDVTVLRNGDLKVTQRIDMKLKERDGDRPWRQLYQQYALKASNLTNIADVSVKNLTTGERYGETAPQSPEGIDESAWNERYARHWYIADVTGGDDDPQPYSRDDPATGKPYDSDRTAEIGWNIPYTNKANSLKFEVTMTLEGVSTAYSDVAKFQWEPFGDRNQIPIGTVNGTVRFPEGVTARNSWAWLHFSGTSTTSRDDDGTLHFTAYDARNGQHLDLVAMFDASQSHGVQRTSPDAAKEATIRDEDRQETQWRQDQQRRARRLLALAIGLSLVGLIVIVGGVAASIRSNRQSQYHGDIEYWRDPPNMSPASAAGLLSVLQKVSASTLSSRQMASTVLSLASKKAIAIYPGASSNYRGIDMSRASASQISAMFQNDMRLSGRMNDTSTIMIMPVCVNNRKSLRLSQSEEGVLQLLEAGAERVGSAVFDLREMKAAFKGWDDGYKVQNRYVTGFKNEFARLGATSSSGGVAKGLGVIAVILGFVGLVGLSANGQLALSLIVGGLTLFGGFFVLFSSKGTGLTEKGQNLAGQVLGLKRYLEHFSDFSDRGPADLVLWDRYLVYAAAFGISKKAVKELAAAYPELRDPQWLDANAGGSLLYWQYRPFFWGMAAGQLGGAGPNAGAGFTGGFDPGTLSANVGDIGAQLTASFADLSSTIQAARPSSSGGSGGSFSSGGFGGVGGGSGGGSFGGR